MGRQVPSIKLQGMLPFKGRSRTVRFLFEKKNVLREAEQTAEGTAELMEPEGIRAGESVGSPSIA